MSNLESTLGRPNRRTCWSVAVLTLITLMAPSTAQAKSKLKVETKSILPLLAGGSPDALAGAIRGYLLTAMPHPLYESRPGWGKTKRIARGIKWKGLRPKLMYKEKEDGKWRHIRATALMPADTLVLDIRNLISPEPGKITFSIFLSMDARVEYRRILWERGMRLLDGSVKARFRIRARLDCESMFRIEPSEVFVPDLVFRLRVVRSHVSYDNFVTEHIAGMGGEGARFLGEMIRSGLKKIDPSVERRLLEKANASIEKSADTKEVRLSLQKVLKKKGWLPSSEKTSP